MSKELVMLEKEWSETERKTNIDTIMDIMNANNGYVTTKQVSKMGIHRMYLNILKQKGIIEQVGTGIYIDVNKIEDSYYILSQELPNIVYSHMTALYFHGFSIKAPGREYDITIPYNYYNYKLKYHDLFYVSKDVYNLGLTTVCTPFGNLVKAYDLERCICDIIRCRKRMDSEHVKHSIKEYVRSKDKDLTKLSDYAYKMNIKDEVLNYVEVFYEW